MRTFLIASVALLGLGLAVVVTSRADDREIDELREHAVALRNKAEQATAQGRAADAREQLAAAEEAEREAFELALQQGDGEGEESAEALSERIEELHRGIAELQAEGKLDEMRRAMEELHELHLRRGAQLREHRGQRNNDVRRRLQIRIEGNRPEEIEQLKRELRELLANRPRGEHPPGDHREDRAHDERLAAEHHDAEQAHHRLERLHAAIEFLSEHDLHEHAERLREEANEIERRLEHNQDRHAEHEPQGELEELRRHMHEMRQHVERLTDEVHRLHEHVQDLTRHIEEREEKDDDR